MAIEYKTPGVYIEEIRSLSPSVVPVETAIPVFIGYTERTDYRGENLLNKPKRVETPLEFEQMYGGAFVEVTAYAKLELQQLPDGSYRLKDQPFGSSLAYSSYRLYYAVQLFYLNGGGPCYVVSVGAYADAQPKPAFDELKAGLDSINKLDGPTLIVFPEAHLMDTAPANKAKFYDLYKLAMAQCERRKDRFTIIDTLNGENVGDTRTGLSPTNAKDLTYGAVYYPYLETSQQYRYDPQQIEVEGDIDASLNSTDLRLFYDLSESGLADLPAPQALLIYNDKKEYYTAHSLAHTQDGAFNQLYQEAIAFLEAQTISLPPSAIMAGVYATVDRTRGVFKAPANVGLTGIVQPTEVISAQEQGDLNKPLSGKAINAIRTFNNRGTLVWGARTLAGNSNEWRYISVRRYFIFVETSVKKAVEQYVYEPNDINTWTQVKVMLDNFLNQQWKAGALQGATPEKAYDVQIGVPTTMDYQDVLEGRMNVVLKLAVVRPAEFIILRFSHIMPQA